MINVTCAIIRDEEHQILIVQRGENTDHPYKWEFPGGKLHDDETEEECVLREIREELSMDIVIFKRLPSVEHDYGHKKIRLIPFICDTLDEFPIMSEHIAYKWVTDMDLNEIDFSEADIYVAKSYLEVSAGKKYQEKISEPANTVTDSEIEALINSMAGKDRAKWVASSAIENPEFFAKLLRYSLSGDTRLAFRASWILTKVSDQDITIIYPYFPQIIESLNKMKNESSLRSFLRIISFSDFEKINESHHGLLTDLCFNILNSGFSSIAVKAYAMEILYKIALIYPELANELEISIRNIMEDASVGILSRGRSILKKLGDMPLNPG